MYTEATTQEQIVTPIALPPEVKVVSGADRDETLATVVMGFSTDPVARWMYPGVDEYLTNFPGFIQALAGKAFDEGSAYATTEPGGAALWLPPAIEPDEQALVSIINDTARPEIVDDLFGMIEQMAENHPDEPHWYLPMIAVDTFRQNRGIGAALLRYSLERCDRDGLSAYLESSNPRNISLYRRFGFEVTGEIQAGSSPTMYPMVRRPARLF